MKIRTDFVTNSSSSSFCVSLSGENIGLEIKAQECEGDYPSSALSVNGISVRIDDDAPYELFDLRYSFGFSPFFLGNLLDLEDAEAIREYILKMLDVTDESILEGIEEPEADEDEEDAEADEDEDEDEYDDDSFDAVGFVEDLVKRSRKIMSSAKKSLMSIKSKEDALSLSVTVEGGGFGEEDINFRKVLGSIFYYDYYITDILDNQELGNDEKFSRLRALPFLKHVSDQGIMNIVEFKDEGYGAKIKQYFDESGKVVLEIENSIIY